MAKLSYADAAKLVGGESPVLEALNKATGGLLLTATAGGSELAVSLFDAKGELARLSTSLVTGLADRLRGLGRYERTDRLAAAQRVLVLTAYFDAVRQSELPFDPARLRLSRPVEMAVATGNAWKGGRLGALAGILLDTDIPTHSPRDRQDTMARSLHLYYRSLGDDLIAYLAAQPMWAAVPEPARERFARTLREEVPQVALRRYNELFTRLATDFPEVAYWAARLDHEATRSEVRELGMGLADLGRVLDGIATGRAPDERRQALTRRYRRQLERPIVATGDVPEGLVIPSLEAGYVNPRYRVAPVIRADRLDEEPWWHDHEVRDDLQDFLIGHLTSLHAVEAPLIVLGQPGSGKSLLTKILSARLPARDFMAVRVVLREVPADADLQSQIEHAIRDATGEQLSWPSLVRAAGDALPVIIFDGFDELLQATNIGQSDYLEQVVRFQEREADQGRPVAVIVTSRTAVADRARIPPGGAVAVRLEPFDEQQVSRWLEAWNAANAAFYDRRGLSPLPAAAVLRQPDLASQPLLLLMLALYDAGDDVLRMEGSELGSAELYERILVRFAEREIGKSAPGLQGDALRSAVEQELLRLSVAAFAMFNRGRQWATEEELTRDLTALLGAPPAAPATGFAVPSTQGQTVVGRFFFVHQAQAIRAGSILTTCEFLHATFGEFLVARLIARELAALAAVDEVTTARGRASADDAFLRSLLSFAPLTSRGQVVDFLAALTRHDDGLRRLLLRFFTACLELGREQAGGGYEPVPLSGPARYAAYSANLLLLVTLATPSVTGRELFPHERHPVTGWRRCAMLWRSQFMGEQWRELVARVRVERIWHEDDRDVAVGLGAWEPPPLDVFWTHHMEPGHPARGYTGFRIMNTGDLRRESYFVCDAGQDLVWHAIEPFHTVPTTGESEVHPWEGVTQFGVVDGEYAMSPIHAMTRLWLVSGQMVTSGQLLEAYETCLFAINAQRSGESEYLAAVLRQLAADRDRLTAGQRARLHDLVNPMLRSHPAVDHWIREAFGTSSGTGSGT
ncbi:hypothetical protein AB0K16_18830 [Nonomuraea jabiensis]|uniref:NACHT domain-containing protein n=1 Tax=Nonomuraea jabiensis TaxID=882448 RepID=UPI003444E38C